ncbi:MAG: hypothetical protein ABI818_14865 [Acidobacteriota bacterium]
MDPIVVPLHSRRRQRGLLVQKVQHAVPATGLIAAGVGALRSGAHGFDLALAIVEMVTSVLLIRGIVQSVLASRTPRSGHDHAHGVDWTDIWAAGVLFAEAGERWHLTHHFARPTILTAIVTLALGLFHGRIATRKARRRSLRVDDDGVHVGGRPFGAFHARWPELATISVTGDVAELRTRAGNVRRVDLADLENRAAVSAALGAARAHLKSLPAPALT